MGQNAIAIANDSKYAVQTKRIEGFLVLSDTNITPLTTDPSVYFQKLWIYPGASATAGVITPNAGNVYVGNTGCQIVSKSVTQLQIKAVSTDKQTLLVTATSVAHGFNTGDVVRISGASDNAYNREWPITKVDADNFTFMLTDVPTTGAPSGTITAAGLQAVTDHVLPDLLLPTDLPLKYELPLGAKQQLASILVKGAANDGVFYRIW
jgi:hypothetical protein